MTNKTFLAAAFVLASALAPALAVAAPNSGAMETKVAVVRTADLNLASPQGKSTLGTRIAFAVNQVCGAAASTVSIEERVAITKCRAKARNTALAVAKIRQDQVLAQR
ncbi:UrcA family protein [Novosphingobium sp.]|uniref:UrcA family protein n=1 Tax=Novosphingobium sp. TaxID=1874826 RepID=UPI003BAB0CC8